MNEYIAVIEKTEKLSKESKAKKIASVRKALVKAKHAPEFIERFLIAFERNTFPSDPSEK